MVHHGGIELSVLCVSAEIAYGITWCDVATSRAGR